MPTNLVTVAGTPFPEPSTYEGFTSTIVDSGRNVQGKLISAVVRDDVAKVTMTWKYLTIAQWSQINSLFKISAGGKFTNNVTFFDQTAGTWLTREMYVGDRKANMFRVDESGNVLGWLNCSLSLIEV